MNPYDFQQAKEACARAARAQIDAERDLTTAATDHAGKEMAYRKALAKTIVTLHDEGMAWTVCQDVARGDDTVARLRYERDVAHGVLEAQQQRAWRHTADRKDVLELVRWSARVAPDGQYEPPPGADVSVIGGRRVAA